MSCTLSLFYRNDRTLKIATTKTLDVVHFKSPDTPVYSTVCTHFDITKQWDKNLIESAFSCDTSFSSFEFVKGKSPNVTCEVVISGKRSWAFTQDPGPDRPLDRGKRKIRVTKLNHNGDELYSDKLTLKDLSRKRNGDNMVVALYNSESFIKATQFSENGGSLLKVVQ